MKRLVVRWKDAHTNIAVDHIEHDDGVVWAWLDNELVGFFDLGSVDALYITEKNEGGKNERL